MEKKERKITRASEAKTTVKKVEEKVQAAEEEAVVETPEEKKMTKEEILPRIIYEDAEWVAFNKPT